MLLVIDVGNTNTVMGIYRDETLVKDWRIRTERKTTEDEFNVIVTSLFATGGIDAGAIRRTIISCVVPPMVTILDSFCRKYLGHAPRWVDARSYDGMPILINNPAELGADRIVNAVAASRKYGKSLIIIDFGTATTFDVVDVDGAYVGGVIAPGVNLSLEALHMAAAALPHVDVTKPQRVVGTNTVACMQSGVFWGYVGLVRGISDRILAERDRPMKIVGTGGLAPLFGQGDVLFDVIEDDLTMHGLTVIHRYNKERG